MASTINASTSPAAIVQTADGTANLNLQSNGTTIAALTSTGMAVTGTLSASGEATISGLTVGKGGGALATNTAAGYQAVLGTNSGYGYVTGLGYLAATTNTTGYYNTAVGGQALQLNSTGIENTAVGLNALNQTTASNNTAVGSQALTANTSGGGNTGIGTKALYANTTASNNTAVGYQAGYTGTTSRDNVLLGYQSGYAITTGYENVYIGRGAGNDVNPTTTGYRNILIGTYPSPSSVSSNNELVMGWNVVGKGSNTGYIAQGSGGVYQGNNSATWSITSDARLKKNIVDNTTGLSAITQIQVRNFEYRLPEEITELQPSDAIIKEGIQLGVIAQELQQTLPDCIKEESTGVLSVQTDNLTWYLVNAVKEQQALITSLTARITALEGA